MRYRGILMDADDTIFDFQTANRVAVGLLLNEIGYEHPQRYDQYQEINHACWRLLEQGRMTQGDLKLARWARFFLRYGINADARWAADRFVRLLGKQAPMLPNAEATVRRIAAERPVLILTNGITEVQRSRLALSPIGDVVSGMVVSQEAGVSKPDPALFRLACDRLGIAPREALMIGDSITSDVAGANRAGIDMCFFNPAGKALPPGMHAEYEVTDLRDCVGIALAD